MLPFNKNTPKKKLNTLSIEQSTVLDLVPEEFPEGPYGAQVYVDQPIGKSTPWTEGQHVITRNQDENPEFSNFKVPHESDLPDL